MPLLRRVDLYLNNGRPPGGVLLSSLTDRSAPNTPAWIEDDKCLVRVRFCELPASLNATATTETLPVDNVVRMSGKKTRGTGARLFEAGEFVKVTSEAEVYYQAVLNLSTAAMNEPTVWGGEQQITVYIDVEISAPAADGGDDPDRFTYQFPVTIVRQSHDEDESVPETDPVYPAAEMIVLKMPANGAYRFASDGGAGIVFQLKNGTTGKFHTVFIHGAEGAETLAIGPAED